MLETRPASLAAACALAIALGVTAVQAQDETPRQTGREARDETNGPPADPQAPEDGITAHEGDGHAAQLGCEDLLAEVDRNARNNQVGGAGAPVTDAQVQQDTQAVDECRAQERARQAEQPEGEAARE